VVVSHFLLREGSGALTAPPSGFYGKITNKFTAVEKELSAGWTVTLTDRRLTAQRLSKLRLRPNSVQRLSDKKVPTGG
jgi:hypothetical protein